MYEIRGIARKKNKPLFTRLHLTPSFVTLSQKRVIRGVRVELTIGVCVPPRFRNPDLPPRQFEKSFETKHME